MNLALLGEIMPSAGAKAATFAPHLSAAMVEFGISSKKQQAAFLAQVCHESGSLRYVKEIADGEAYEGREDLGNTAPGDGRRYKGRGLIQITGKANYAMASKDLGEDFLSNPEKLEQPKNACRSAAWFWNKHGLNELADQDKFGSITKRINGGYNGLDDRLAHWVRAMKLLGV